MDHFGIAEKNTISANFCFLEINDAFRELAKKKKKKYKVKSSPLTSVDDLL